MSPTPDSPLDPVRIPDVARVYAIGDVHGMASLLISLLNAIHLREVDGDGGFHIVFIGDLIDRGPHSRPVVEAARELVKQGFATVLCGNHEQLAVDALDAPEDRPLWLQNGGGPTMDSYRSVEDMRDDLEWFRHLPTLAEDALRYYVHAGLMPGKDPRNTSRHTRLWIRGAFLDRPYDYGKHVVHGHTPDDSFPEGLAWRTNLDTGCVHGGPLTAAVFDRSRPHPIEIMQAKPDIPFIEVIPYYLREAA